MASSSMADELRFAALKCCNVKTEALRVDGSVNEFVDVLMAPFKIPDREREWELECGSLLQQARTLLDPSVPSGKELLDLIGADLPKVVVQYSGVSEECQQSSSLIIQGLAKAFEPAREMFTALFEAINIYSKPETRHLCLPLVRGISLVFPRITRRTAEFFKEALPGLLELGRFTGSPEVDTIIGSVDDIIIEELNLDGHLLTSDHLVDNIQSKVISELIFLAKVIKGICDSDHETARLRDMLGIFTLQLLTIACAAESDSNRAVPDVALELMQLLSFSSISLSSLVCTADVDRIFNELFAEEGNNVQEDRLEAQRGAAIAVFLGIQIDEEFTTGGEIVGLKEMFRTPGRKMVLDVIELASILLVPMSGSLDVLHIHKGLSLMTYILELYSASSKKDDTNKLDGLETSTQILLALQRLQDVIVYIPSPMLRRQAFGILVKVISEVFPTRARFGTLLTLISGASHPSLVSLLLTCAKDEIHKSWPTRDLEQKPRKDLDRASTFSLSPFSSQDVLEFIQCVLRTKDGEIVELPANLDSVLGALNLYRYLLIRESADGTNYTQVTSRDELVKGRMYWLLPLKNEVLRVQNAMNAEGTDADQDIQLAMDFMQDVLYRCLEIVEELLAKIPDLSNCHSRSQSD